MDDLESTVGWTGDFGNGSGSWNINSGPTGSSNTGPNAAYSGSNYFYYEASGSSENGVVSNIVSPTIDLTSATGEAELSFYYHLVVHFC